MATAQRQQPTAQTVTTDQDSGAKILNAILDRPVAYMPFQSKTEITLSPRMVIAYLCNKTKKGFKCSEEQAIKFCRLCQARGLNPWEGDAYLVGYDSDDGPTFSLITAHQAFLKRAEVHPDFDGMESGTVVKRDGKVIDIEGDWTEDGDILLGGWARVHFKAKKVPAYRRVKLATFDTGYSRWKKDKCGMIVKVAEADALRSSFPNTLGGMYIEAEMPVEHSARPQIDMPRALNEPAPGNGHKDEPKAPVTDAPDDAPSRDIGEQEEETSGMGLPQQTGDPEDCERDDWMESFMSRVKGAKAEADVEALHTEAKEKSNWLGEKRMSSCRVAAESRIATLRRKGK